MSSSIVQADGLQLAARNIEDFFTSARTQLFVVDEDGSREVTQQQVLNGILQPFTKLENRPVGPVIAIHLQIVEGLNHGQNWVWVVYIGTRIERDGASITFYHARLPKGKLTFIWKQ